MCLDWLARATSLLRTFMILYRPATMQGFVLEPAGREGQNQSPDGARRSLCQGVLILNGPLHFFDTDPFTIHESRGCGVCVYGLLGVG